MSNSKKWLDAQLEPSAAFRALPSYLALADLKNDNYYKLIAVEVPADLNSDVKSKLKVYKGTTLISEQGLPGYPTAIQSLYVDDNAPKIPIIAVAIGPAVYFYKNMKPYYKYTLPSLPIDSLEKDIWNRLPIDKADNYDASIKKLKSMSIKDLSIVSQNLLTLSTDERQDFIEYHAERELQRLPTIVAMATIRRSAISSSVISSLILASEFGDIIILDTQAFTIMHQARTSSFNATPSLLSVSGQVDIDFRIVIATREGAICMLRKGWLEGKQIFRVDHPAIGLSLLPIEQTIIVVCMNCSLDCFTKKGKKLWSVELSAPAVCMVPVLLQHIGQTLVCVALRGGLVQLYMNKVVVDQFNVSETVSAMTFGRLGQEDHVLILVTIQGSLIVKILKRTADFKIETVDFHTRNRDNSSGNLQIPKKTKVFVEQTIRERENAPDIYNSFQSELWRLRLMAARSTVEAINSAESTISGDIGQAPIKLTAEVCGLGPIYQLFLVIENMAARKIAFNLNALIHFNHKHYQVESPYMTLPPIVPGAPVKFNIKISAIIHKYDNLPPIDLTPENSFVKVMIVKNDQAKPLLVATVTMPPLEIIDNDIY